MFKLKPNPTFWAKVEIPVPGADPETIEFEFRHMGRKALIDLKERMEGRPKIEMLCELVVGWRGPDVSFSTGALTEFDDSNLSGADLVISAYLEEMSGARRKNL